VGRSFPKNHVSRYKYKYQYFKKILQVAYSVLVYENDKYSTEYGTSTIISKKCNFSIYRSVPGAKVGESGKIAGQKKYFCSFFLNTKFIPRNTNFTVMYTYLSILHYYITRN
jgi:hypothetical protein